MPATEQLLPFLLAAMLLTATPGPDNLMVLSVGAARGRRMGMAFGLGCAAGCLSHTLLAVLGAVFTLQAAVLFGALGWFAGGIGQWLQRRPRAGLWRDRLAGAVFVGLGLRLVMAR